MIKQFIVASQDIKIQYFKQNPVGKLYERLGFKPDDKKSAGWGVKAVKLARNSILCYNLQLEPGGVPISVINK